MKLSSKSAFECFVVARTKHLQRIANFTAGQHAFHDVVNESWLVAWHLSKDETLAELQNVEFQDQVLREVRRVLASPADRIFRKPVMLGSGGDDEDDTSGTHPLMHILTSDSPDPLDELLNQDETAVSVQVEDSMEIICSLAGAYICLLNHFSDWRRVAQHLDISTLTVNKHYRQALFLVAINTTSIARCPKVSCQGSGTVRESDNPFGNSGSSFLISCFPVTTDLPGADSINRELTRERF
jgi:hypothetical protein